MRVLLTGLLLFSVMQLSFSQCELSHKIDVEYTDLTKEADGLIKIQLEQSINSQTTIKLYRINKGEIKLETEQVIANGTQKTEVQFKHLPPGRYYPVAEWEDCRISLGGIKGITITQK